MNALFKRGLVGMIAGTSLLSQAEFKAGYSYTGIEDHGDYLTYNWVFQVAGDSTEPMYAVVFHDASLQQLGFFNIQNNRNWNLWHRPYSDGVERSVWFECIYTNRVFPGETFRIQADIGKRLISNPDRLEVGVMTGLPLSEGGEGILAVAYIRIAKLHSSTGGMSKAWANQYGIVPEGATMQAYNAAEPEDPDGDGFSNLEEYIADTDPMDPASYMKPFLIPSEKGKTIVSAWPLSDQAVYDLYGAKNEKKPLEYMGSFEKDDVWSTTITNSSDDNYTYPWFLFV